MARTPKQTKQKPIEVVLWKSADKLRKNIDAAEYKHAILGLIFLKYISDSFEEHYKKLVDGQMSLHLKWSHLMTSLCYIQGAEYE